MASLISQELALHVDGDLLRQVALRDRDRDLRHVAQLHGEVARHRVDVVGQVLPRPGDVAHFGLAAQLPSLPTSLATRVTSDANELSWSTIVLIVTFSSRISPRTSTVIFLRDRRWRRRS